jgi:hypothetical protein
MTPLGVRGRGVLHETAAGPYDLVQDLHPSCPGKGCGWGSGEADATIAESVGWHSPKPMEALP